MATNFLVIFALLLVQRFCLTNTTMLMTSSNVTCTQRERQSLLTIKQSLTDKYNLLSSWKGVECCEWQGVGCDSRNGDVVKLDLRSTESFHWQISGASANMRIYRCLEGELSHSLQNLKHLRYLDLSMNNFSGNIPEFLGSFQSLEYLNLSFSGFDFGVVPHHLGNLSRLQYLDLRSFYHQRLGFGQVYTLILDDLGWVSSLASLRYLDLSGITIGKHIDWFHSVNMLPSLLTLNLASSDIAFPTIKFVNFTSLNLLDLSFNYIDSNIPIWFSNLTGLMHLNLFGNNFHGEIPDFLGMLNSLASMDLTGNSFDILIPDLLCNLSSLVHLSLAGNTFSGPIPTCLGLLSRLEDLFLAKNKLSGNIPTSLGQLSKLKRLDLLDNKLAGFLSEGHFIKLKNLNRLVLSGNSLAFNICSLWIPPFQLQTFYAGSLNIGPHIPNWLQTQTNLQVLDLSNSGIRDEIPTWFNNAMSSICHLDLSDNLLSGQVPLIDETLNKNLKIIILSKNRFTGSFPEHLCMVPSIQVLDLSHNYFSGRLPGCLVSLIKMGVLDVANNSITGAVPSSLGSLKLLESLHLQNNRLEGHIPMSLQNMTKLITLDLGNNLFNGSIPLWIGEKLSTLRYLDLHSNKFRGKIPLQLCQLNDLRYLSLAHNNITGTIPRCFENLSGMISDQDNWAGSVFTYNYKYEENIFVSMKGIQLVYTKTIFFLRILDLSINNITGEIPEVLMKLVGLKNLNLSGNQLTGHIPMTIGNLTQMESLDLSMNMLSGQIPQSLATLKFLSYLNLSFNNFSGAIPTGNQLQTLADPSIYEGNEGLCGPPVSSSCKGNNSTHNHVGEDDSQDDDEGLWYYGGMGSGFFAGFMGLVGSLYIIRAWRLAYFKILANVYGWLYVQIMLTLARLRRKFF